MAHLSDDEIEQFLAARLHPDTQQEVIRHLLAGCGACSRKIAERVPGRLLEEVEEGRRGKTGPATPRVRAIAREAYGPLRDGGLLREAAGIRLYMK